MNADNPASRGAGGREACLWSSTSHVQNGGLHSMTKTYTKGLKM
jgi:hypothetical protein